MESAPNKVGNLQHKIGSFVAFLAAMAAANPKWAPYSQILIFISGALGATGAATNAVENRLK